jgi:D-alanyl-D-alanine carboxypeptidase/D-alanyl-D-alanine-endopeptidase (penicillin-binding protein 4)
MPEMIASLPLSAVDGTMKKRLNGNGIAGQAHIKTGTLEGVKTIAGYVLDKHGRQQIVVFFVNHPNAKDAQAAQDALLTWVHDGSR